MGASCRAVTNVNARWPRKCVAPEAEPATVRAKAARLVAGRLTRRAAPAGWLATARRPGHIEQLEKPSSSRREIGGSRVGPITGSTGKWADDERVADGPAVCAGQRDGQEGSSPSGARMRGAVSEGGGNSSPAGERQVWRTLRGHEGESRTQPRGTWSHLS